MAIADESAHFSLPNGMRYYRFLSALHEKFIFDWYMEIGCREGHSFADVRSRTIAVDPAFALSRDVLGRKPELHLIQKTSDDFFASGFLKAHGVSLSLSFLDGMHLFEYLLRDFIGTEQASHRDGVILLHDCCPRNYEMTTRDLDNLPKGAWTGDVWKLIPILQKYRPDLEITVFNCQPTGLVAVSNLDPGNTVLQAAYDQIVAEFVDLDLETFGVEAFYGSFSYTLARKETGAGFPLFHKLGREEEVPDIIRVTP